MLSYQLLIESEVGLLGCVWILDFIGGRELLNLALTLFRPSRGGMIELQLLQVAKGAAERSKGTGGLTTATVVRLIRSLFGV